MTDAEKIAALEKRIADLEDRVGRLADPLRHVTPYVSLPIRTYDVGRCIMCGGYHGSLPCPTMTPMCVDTH